MVETSRKLLKKLILRPWGSWISPQEFCFVVKKLLKSYAKKNRSLIKNYPELADDLAILSLQSFEEFCPRATYQFNHQIAFGNEEIFDFEHRVFEYAQDNIAIVSVYFREPFAERLEISPSIQPTAFMSDIGGLLGFFMGCSVITGMEIIYYSLKVQPTYFQGQLRCVMTLSLEQYFKIFQLRYYEDASGIILRYFKQYF